MLEHAVKEMANSKTQRNKNYQVELLQSATTVNQINFPDIK
jgi:hypothetical protein